ncbi:MAG TPA: hypothetical protein VM074_05325 [Solimonas sp.]|nr:hypothetical protein [Solimonas sp.]
MIHLRPAARGAGALLATLVLGACGDDLGVVGTGTNPTGVAIGDSRGRLTTFATFECLTSALAGYLEFSTDGQTSLEEVTTRMQWSSSDPETVYVGDGVSAGPEGVVLGPGNFIGLRPGFATITVHYLGLAASLPVEVVPIAALRIGPALSDVGEHLQQQFELQAQLTQGSAWSDFTEFARWSLARPDSQASVDEASGLLTANRSNGADPVALHAELPACGRSVDTSFRVSPVQGLELDYEAGDATTLPLGYSEAVRVFARFAPAGSTRQNVSGQVGIADLADDVLGVSQNPEGLLVATTEMENSGGFRVTWPDAGLEVASKLWQTRELGLLAIALEPESLDLRFPDSGSFSVLGSFEDQVAWPVTRHVGWSSDSALASVVALGLLAGTVTISDVTENVNVTAAATDVDGAALSATGRVAMHAYADP